jgi:hypothetical protein
MRLTHSVAAIMFCLALASCATGPLQVYDGLALPDSQTALISAPRAANDRTAANIRILSADDARGEPVRVMSRSIRVVPRGVCIEARATTSTQDSMVSELCFNVYAGSRYEVRALVSGASSGASTAMADIIDGAADLQNAQSGPFTVSRLFVIDTSTRRIVASTSP